MVCDPCLEEFSKPYPFPDKAEAKSSSATLIANACQGCGCKRDGKTMRKGCECQCHK